MINTEDANVPTKSIERYFYKHAEDKKAPAQQTNALPSHVVQNNELMEALKARACNL